MLQNGGFEAPAIADASLQAVTPASWTGGAALMNPNTSGAISGNPFTWPQPAEGQQYDDIGNTPATPLSQAFTVTTAATYRITWQDNTGLNIVPGFRTAPYLVTLIDGSSQQVFSLNLDSYHPTGAWETRTTDRVLSAGTYTLTFASQNSANRTDTLIDAVSVKAVP